MNIMLLSDGITNQRHLAAVRRGVLLNMPLVVIGAFAVMMSEVSVLRYQQLMMALFGPNWAVFWQTIASASRNGISIVLVISVSYFLAEKHNQVRAGRIHPLTVALVSFTCLLALIQPFNYEGINGFLLV